MATKNGPSSTDIAAVNAELERLMAEEEALKLEVAEMVRMLDGRWKM